MNYEDHLRAELTRLKGEMSAIERSLDMFLQWKAANHQEPVTPSLPLNGTGFAPLPMVLTGRPAINKTAFITNQIKDAGQDGVSTHEIYKAVDDQQISMSRDHIRSALWHGVHDGKFIKRENGKYVLKSEGPNA